MVGYFFKMQGYQPGSAKPNDRATTAPLLIGRIKWLPAAIPRRKASDWKWGLGAVAVIIVVALAFGLLHETNGKRRR